ncbi:MAG: lipoyl(octanoyl) transferase LipB [Clostridia bacterium]|jgi:lipoyl(octanoyl) transferase
MQINVVNLNKIDYGAALEIQLKLLEARQKGTVDDTLLMLEHPPTLTLGMRGRKSNILVPEAYLKESNIDIYDVNRGGDVTYHGDGQVVGYPIFDLTNYNRDIKKFIWNIEEVFIRLIDKEYNITAKREDMKYTGVWIGDNKITAIGMAVKHWVTMHGFAFNVNTNLEHFKLINPCGLTEKGVTSLQQLTGVRQDFAKLNQMVIESFCEVFEVTSRTVDLKELGI